MAAEQSQLKFAKSEASGELISFVSRHSKTKKLKGVRENSIFGKKICVLSKDLKGAILPNILYHVELKSMHQGNGYVVVSAIPVLFKAHIETIIIPKSIYQVNIVFGNKTIYFDPKDGKSPSSKTMEGVLEKWAYPFPGINLKTGKQIFLEDIGNQTVNIGEFLGVIAAAKYIIENDYQPRIIYTDSMTALTWFTNKRKASKKKYPALKKAEVFLKTMSFEIDQIQVIHWDNELLGEIPADFGNK